MPDGSDTTEKLFARAEAAVRESWCLVAENHEWRQATEAALRRRHFLVTFEPKTLKFFSPLDFAQPRKNKVSPATASV